MKLSNYPTTIPCPVWAIVLCLAGLQPGLADRIFLKSGEEISGKIVSETDDDVRIEVRTGTIKDTRLIKQVSISRIEKTTPEQIDFEQVHSLRQSPDGLSKTSYQERVNVVDEFLAKYPESENKQQAESIRQSLKQELGRVIAGYVKYNGAWLSPAQKIVHKKNLEATGTFNRMYRSGNSGQYLSAMRGFERIERNYPGTLAFPDSIEAATQILRRYQVFLSEEIPYAKEWVAQNAKGMARLRENARIEQERINAQEKLRFQKQVEAELKSGTKWVSVDLKDEASLNEGIQRVLSERQRLAKFNVKPFREQAQALYEAAELIFAQKIPEAETALADALKIPGGVKFSSSSSKKGDAQGEDIVSYLRGQIALTRDRLEKERLLADRANTESGQVSRRISAETKTEQIDKSDADGLETLRLMVGSGGQEAPVEKAEPKTKKKPESRQEKAAKPRRATPPPKRGFSFGKLMPIILVILLGVTGFLYYKDKKAKEGGDSGGE